VSAGKEGEREPYLYERTAMAENTIPTLVELDADGEATGAVYHFCSEACRTLFHKSGEGCPGTTVAYTWDGDAELISGEICSFCGEEFVEATTLAVEAIGNAAGAAELAYARGDYETLKTCLRTIRCAAEELGYRATTQA
jgi:hypothetical protein